MNQATAAWEGKTAEEWQQLLHVPLVLLYESVGSTNDSARAQAESGAPHLTTVISNQQTLGRGRNGSQWHSTPGSSLLCSILFRIPGNGAPAPGAVPVRVGLAVADAIERVTGVEAAVKWPNDVVIASHGKVAGVLCEGVFRQTDAYIVAGIGINVRSVGAGYASLQEITGAPVSRAALLSMLLAGLHDCAQRIATPLQEPELAMARARDILFDQDVETADGVRGRASGIADDGSLNLQTADGMRAIHTATIRLADSRAYPGART